MGVLRGPDAGPAVWVVAGIRDSRPPVFPGWLVLVVLPRGGEFVCAPAMLLCLPPSVAEENAGGFPHLLAGQG